jgi:hypothetical protein
VKALSGVEESEAPAVRVVFTAQTMSQLMLRDELQQLAQGRSSVRVRCLLTQQDVPADEASAR